MWGIPRVVAEVSNWERPVPEGPVYFDAPPDWNDNEWGPMPGGGRRMRWREAAKERIRSPWCHLYRLYPFEMGSQGDTKSFPNTLLRYIRKV